MESCPSLWTGCRRIEIELLNSISAMTEMQSGDYVSCSEVIAELNRSSNMTPKVVYQALLDMARPWRTWIPLLEVGGDCGDRTFSADDPEMTRCRLSEAGHVAMGATRKTMAPVPLGLINGSLRYGGRRPPLDPFRVIASLREMIRNPNLTTPELLHILGPPSFPSGCDAQGDFDALFEGRRILLSEVSIASVTGVPVLGSVNVASVNERRLSLVGGIESVPAHIVIESLPGAVNSTSEIVNNIQASPVLPASNRAALLPCADVLLPIRYVYDKSQNSQVRIEIVLQGGADAISVHARLATMKSMVHTFQTEFPMPIREVFSRWIGTHLNENIEQCLDTLKSAIVVSRACTVW